MFSFSHLNPRISLDTENGAFTLSSITSVSVAILSPIGALAAFCIGESTVSTLDLLLANVVVDDDKSRKITIYCDAVNFDKMQIFNGTFFKKIF